MEVLRSFRRNAVHVRNALDFMAKEPGQVGVERGYLQDAGLIEQYKRLSIPVRRALNPSDRASFDQALAALGEPVILPPPSKTPPPPPDPDEKWWKRLLKI